MLQTATVRDRRSQVTRNRAEIGFTRRWDRVVVLANRAPFRHDRVDGGKLHVSRSSGGLVTAVEPLIKEHGGKFLAVERLLEDRADLRGHFVFVQVAEPSRDCLPAYQATRAELVATAARVNARFRAGSYKPILLLEKRHDPTDVYRFYRAADLCCVGSLRDGMNLVAKEFVEARDDEQGVLILSEFAGAARQLRAALLINPRDAERSAAALARGLEMPVAEQQTRMRVLRANVATCDVSWWARQLMSDAARHRYWS